MSALAVAPTAYHLNVPTPVEEHEGVAVKREDYIDTVIPAGKLRGVIPLFEELRRGGAVGVVNAAASHSNSHAVCAYVGGLVGLGVRSVANTSRLLPNLQAAQRLGGFIELVGPMHMQPLRSRATAMATPYWPLLPWAFSHPTAVLGIAQAVLELTESYDVHVVPVGAGPFMAGIVRGLELAGRHRERVVGVCGLGLRASTVERVAYLVGSPAGLPPTAALVAAPGRRRATPWPSDPHYEHWAWPVAKQYAADGERVLFWSVGRPVE